MHLSEGVASVPVLVTGAVLGIGLAAAGLKKTDPMDLPKTAMLAAAFFAAALVRVPIGPACAHLTLNGFLGLLLGWAAIPAILVAIFLQAALFQFGGLTTLGINLVVMAAPALVVWLLFAKAAGQKPARVALIAAFFAGATGIVLGASLMAGALAFSGEPFFPAARLILAVHLPVAVIEGLFTAFALAFIRRSRPELFDMEPLHVS